MKKKFLITILSLVCLLVCSFALAACGGTPDKPSDGAHTHTHKYVWTDNRDGTHDGHCAVSGCDRPDVKNESHVWGANDKCTKCGSAKDGGEVNPPAHSHSWSKAWASDETHHWHECTASGCPIADNAQKDGYGAHSYNASTHKCVCGKRDPNTPTEGLEYALNEDNESYYVKGIGTATDTEIVIASEYQGKPVTRIGENAFKNNNKLTGITVPSGVTAIGQDAFLGCTALANIRYTGDIKSWCEIDELHNLMEHGAAKKLIIDGKEIKGELIIPDGVTSIADAAFGYCTDLTGVKLPDSLTYIGNAAFASCMSLTSVEIPDSLKTIGGGVFGYCLSLTSLTLPAQLETIGDYVFMGCHALSIYCEKTEKPESWQENWDIYEWNVYTQRGKHCPVIWDCKNNDADKDGYAYSVVDGIRYSFKDSVAAVVNQPANLKEANIPASVTYKNKVYNVTNIADYAFRNCGALTSVIMPNGVTSIGNSAFYGCKSLTNIIIPISVSSIGSSAFYGCNDLRYTEYNNACYLGNAENEHLWLIKAKDTSVTSCTVHDNSKFIYDSAFSHCESLESVTLPDGLNSIGKNAFEYCSSLESIDIPDGVKSIENSMFYYCSNLTSITIPDSVTNIGNRAFFRCESLKSVTLPDSVTNIGDSAFYTCNSLTSVTIPQNVANIGDAAFGNCDFLIVYCEAAAKPAGWDNDWASNRYPIIWDCKNNDADQNGYAYAIIGNMRYALKNGIASVISLSKTITEANIAATVTFKNDVYSVTSIDDSAFDGCSSLTSVTIPDGVTSIGDWAFSGCNSLTTLTIPDSVTNIGNRAFDDCTDLQYNEYDNVCYLGNDGNKYLWLIKATDTSVTSCTVHEGTKAIYDSAFSDCYALESITLPDGLNSIGEKAFENCYSLESIDIPDGVKSIEYATFNYCTNLTSVTLPDGITNIGDSAFSNCNSLTSVTIPDGVTSIGAWAFSNCTDLTSVVIPNSVTSIGIWAFKDCDKLQHTEYENAYYIGNDTNPYLMLIDTKSSSDTSYTIHENTKFIGSDAFYYCSSFKSITIPSGVISIGGEAFYGCYTLESITIPNSVTSIDQNAFHGCSSLENINYNGTMEEWKAISKKNSWASNTSEFTVTCTDGTLDKDGNEINQ